MSSENKKSAASQAAKKGIKRKVLRNLSSRFPKNAKVMEESLPLDFYLKAKAGVKDPATEREIEKEGKAAKAAQLKPIKEEPIEISDDEAPTKRRKLNAGYTPNYPSNYLEAEAAYVADHEAKYENAEHETAAGPDNFEVPKTPAPGTPAPGAGAGSGAGLVRTDGATLMAQVRKWVKQGVHPQWALYQLRKADALAQPKPKAKKAVETYDEVLWDSILSQCKDWEARIGKLPGLRKDLVSLQTKSFTARAATSVASLLD